MKTHPIRIKNLRVVEAGQFIIRYFSDVQSLGINLKTDSNFYKVHTLLKNQSDAYDEALKQIRAMAETKELETLDRYRDYKIITLRRAVSVFEYSDIKKEQEAYRMARIIMKNYAGLESENYEAETFSIQKLLEEWNKPEHNNIRGILGLQQHLENLRQSAAAFDDLFDNRSSAVTQKVTYDTLALKKDMMDTYNNLVDYIASVAVIRTDSADFYYKILDAINNGRRYFSDLLAKRNGGNHTDEEPATAE